MGPAQEPITRLLREGLRKERVGVEAGRRQASLSASGHTLGEWVAKLIMRRFGVLL
jgi:hypothetical protein